MLIAIGLEIDGEERESCLYGESTKSAGRGLQRLSELEETGTTDASTVEVIIAAARRCTRPDADDDASDEYDDRDGTKGRRGGLPPTPTVVARDVTDGDGQPLAGAARGRVDCDVRSTKELGSANTDAAGSNKIPTVRQTCSPAAPRRI